MKPILFLVIFFSLVFFVACTTTKTSDYFKLNENKVETYNGIFKKPNDNNYKQMEQTYGSVSKNDLIIDKTEIVYKTFDIEGYKAFYAINTKDTLAKNPNIGPRHFLFSAMIFSDDTVFVAPVYEKADLKKLRFSDFKYKIPPYLTKKDSVVIINRKQNMILLNFRHENLLIDNKNFSDCLAFDIKEIWPDIVYSGQVWLHKKYGILKWIRSTGRIETRIF